MAITLQVQLTDAQQALMVQIANSVLPLGNTNAQKIAWATKLAADGLAAEVSRIGVTDIDDDAREAQNTTRRTFLASVAAAWPQ